MANEKVTIKLSADTAQYIADLKRAGHATAEQTARMGTAFNFVQGAAIGMAGALSAGMFVNFVRASIDSVDALNDLKDATGASIENISALEDVALRTGSSFDAVGTSLIKFNKVLNDAKPGSKAAAAIKALGLDLNELKSLDPAEALRRTAVALNGFAEDGNKGRLMVLLFNKSVEQMAPFLKDLAEKGELVAKVTTAQAEEAEKFNKQLFEMKKNVLDVTREISGPLITAFNSLMDKSKEVRKYSINPFDFAFNLGENYARGGIAGTAGDTSDRTGSWGNAIPNRSATRLLRQGDLGKSSVGDIGGDKDKAKIDPLIKALAVYNDLTAKASGLNADFAEKWEALSLVYGRGKISVVELTEAQKNLLSEQTFSRDLTKEQEESLKETVKTIDRARESSARYLESLASNGATLEISNKALREQFEEIGLTTEALNQLTLARLDANIAQEQEIVTMAAAAGTGEQELALMQRKIDLLKEERELTEKKQGKQISADIKKKLEETSKDYAVTLHADVKTALSNAFRDSQDPVAAFGDALANVVFTRVTASLTDAMATQLVGSGKSGDLGLIGSLFSSFVSFDGGGSTGPGARTGGMDGKGGFMALLHPQETVVDHTRGQSTQGTRGGDTFVININAVVGDVASKTDVVNGMRATAAQIQAAITRSRTHGGALA